MPIWWFVHVLPALESPMLEGVEAGVFREHRHVEHPRSENHVVGEVVLVDGDRDAVGGYCLLHHSIGDATVVLVAFVGSHDEEPVGEFEKCAVVHISCS